MTKISAGDKARFICQNEDCAVCIIDMGASWEAVKSQFGDAECICKIPDKALRLKGLEVVFSYHHGFAGGETDETQIP